MAHYVLDNPVWSALTGPHQHLAVAAGRFLRYRGNVAVFAGVADTADGFGELGGLLPPGAAAGLVATGPVPIPDGMDVIEVARVLQMVAQRLRAVASPLEMMPLRDADIPAMVELTRLTQPGPFLERTIEMGHYIGIFDGPRLVAMAGERMSVPGYTEVSAVCTHPDYQGRGYAKALVSEIAGGIVERGLTPFLHVRANNAVAIAAYEKLGFATRHEMIFTFVKRPD